MGTVPPCHGLARRGSFIWIMILVSSRGSVCGIFVRATTVTLHKAPVDILPELHRLGWFVLQSGVFRWDCGGGVVVSGH